MNRWVLLVVGVALCLGGCGGPPARPNPPVAGGMPPAPPGPLTAPVTPEPVAPPPMPPPKPMRNLAETVEKPANVKFVPIEFKVGKVVLTMEVPEGVKAKEDGVSSSNMLTGGEHFALNVQLFTIMKPENLRSQYDAVKGTVLADAKVGVAGVWRLGDETRAEMAAVKMLGTLNYYMNSADSYYGQDEQGNSKNFKTALNADDVKVLLYSASTLARKSPPPEDPVEFLKELDVINEGAKPPVTKAEISIHDTEETGKLLAKLPDLRTLSYYTHYDWGSPECARELAFLATLPIDDLTLSHNYKLADDHLAPLAPLKLAKFKIDYNDMKEEPIFTGAGLKHLNSSGLKELDLQLYWLTDDSLAVIAGLPALEVLRVGRGESSPSEITNSGVAHLAKLAKLKELKLTCNTMTDAAMDSLAKLPALETLELENAKLLTDAGIAKLAAMPNLQSLRFDNVPLTDATLTTLATGFPALKSVSFDKTKITKEAAKQLEEKRKGLSVYGP